MPTRALILTGILVALVTTTMAVLTGAGEVRAEPAQNPPAQSLQAQSFQAQLAITPQAAAEDPAVLHLRLLARMDAEINAQATRAHMEARRTLEEMLPVPYLGLDVTPDSGGVKVDHVYPYSGAEAAGVLEGDVLMRLDQSATDSKNALARAVRSHRTGQNVALSLLRAGQSMTLSARIGGRPEEDEDEEEQFPDLPIAPMTTAVRSFDFESATSGEIPAGLASALGGYGAPARWVAVTEGTQHFLRQTADDHTGMRFPMAIVADIDAADVVATVRFRYSGGKSDRAAGLILRYRDPGNYLVARANQGEADLRIFRVVNGLRTTLPGGVVACPTKDDQWHTLEFRCEGPKVTATLDGQATASSYDTFFRRGAAGLWTKSDSVTDFDDARFEPIVQPHSPPKPTGH